MNIIKITAEVKNMIKPESVTNKTTIEVF